jgi:predicted esterase
MSDAGNPHFGRPLIHAGAALAHATVAAVLVHGRDQDAAVMLDLVARLQRPAVAYVLAEAHGRSWYPGRYHDPPAANEPALGHALAAVRRALDAVAAAGIAPGQTVLAGFSQGGCLVAELVLREPRAYGGVAVLTGALIGPPDAAARTLPDLGGLPVFLGTAVRDAWVAPADVERTAATFAAAGAVVEVQRHEALEHAIHAGDVVAVRALLDAAAQAG